MCEKVKIKGYSSLFITTMRGNRVNYLKIIALMVLFLGGNHCFSQDYQFHKVYIYNFTKYIQWPPEMQGGDFVIGVYGKSSMINELKAMSLNRTVGAQKITVKEIHSPQDASTCHVVFVPSGKSGSLTDLKSKLDGRPTLIITEKDGLAKQGSAINFVLVDGKLKYELNKNSIDKAGLKVMPDLVKLAILINT